MSEADTGRAPLPTLLGAGEPAPVERLRPGAGSPFFLTCEHAGRRMPARLGTLGLPASDLDRHIAYDIGAAGVARRLSELLGATLIMQRYSRLVVDCNRWPSADDYITTHSEDTAIPGNRNLSPGEIEARTREIFLPYHDAIRDALDARMAQGRATVLVSVHSCTPVYLGVWRPWHIGILYERDRRLAGMLLELFGEEAELEVGDNEPYFMTDAKDYAVPVHGERRGILHVELEIRQDLVGAEAGQAEWAQRIAAALTAALRRLQASGEIASGAGRG